MGDHRELRFLLAVIMIGLFTVSAYHILSLGEIASSARAYQAGVIAALALVWGLMCWISYEDPVRFREVITVTMVGFVALALLEILLIMSGSAAGGRAVSPLGPSAPLEDAVWAEVGLFGALALLLFYLRPDRKSLPPLPKE